MKELRCKKKYVFFFIGFLLFFLTTVFILVNPITKYEELKNGTVGEKEIIVHYNNQWTQYVDEVNFDAISIKLATYCTQYEFGTLNIRFFEEESGKILDEVQVSATKIQDNQFLTVETNVSLVNDSDKIIMELWMEDFEGYSLALYCTEDRESIIMEYYQNDYSELIWSAFLVIVFWIVVICILGICLKNSIKKIQYIQKKLVWSYITIGVLASWIVMFVFSMLTFSGLETWWFIAFLAMTVAIIILMFYENRTKPETIVSYIILFLGAYLCVTMPQGAVSWDDHIHYKRALATSHFYSDQVTDGEMYFTGAFIENVEEEESIAAKKKEINILHQEEDTQYIEDSINLYSRIAYIPAALLMVIARWCCMPIHAVYYMGRMGMVFMYAFLVYQAIKRLKSGKMILATIALIPTNLFLCATYSYDPWVTGFNMLGISVVISELQQPDKPMSVKDIVIMLTSFLLMGSAKAIYFPLVALAFLIKPSKFANSKQYKTYLLSVCAVIVALMLSFILPMFFSGTEAISDIRGGSDVNGMQQILFILKNPVEYAKILLNFLKSYLSVSHSQGYMTFWAYLGSGVKFEILIVLLGIVAFTDKNEYDLNLKWGHKGITFCIAFVTIVLVATSLYISFTPVALETINGCQPRYIMPIVFPILYMIGSSHILNKMNTSRYMGTIFGVELYVICSTIWKTCITLYM